VSDGTTGGVRDGDGVAIFAESGRAVRDGAVVAAAVRDALAMFTRDSCPARICAVADADVSRTTRKTRRLSMVSSQFFAAARRLGTV
jgi:hypothetical protein